MKHQTITADDGELLDIRLTGNGTPILLLHGWTSSHASWAPLIKPLMGRCCLLRPDARAHGGHPLTQPGKPDVQRLARDVINLLDHLGIEKIAAVGHSMGALTLWQCIRDFGTQRFSHLAFIDQSPKLVTTDTWNGGIYSDFNAERAQRMLDDFNADFVEGAAPDCLRAQRQSTRDLPARYGRLASDPRCRAPDRPGAGHRHLGIPGRCRLPRRAADDRCANLARPWHGQQLLHGRDGTLYRRTNSAFAPEFL
ncbi:MAG: alpha/beta hydrolase [Propionivibrio sp.]|nr:alpha/beta hydrolase [Propionivibrio sp.]